MLDLARIASVSRKYYHLPFLNELWRSIYSALTPPPQQEGLRMRDVEYDYGKFIPSLRTTTPYKLTKLKILGKKEEVSAVNIDCGGLKVKAGFAGDDNCRIFPSYLGANDDGMAPKT